MCKENIDPKDLENQVNPCSEENNTGEDGNPSDDSGNNNNSGNVGNTGQSGSSGDGKPVRPQPNWGFGGLSIENPNESH